MLSILISRFSAKYKYLISRNIYDTIGMEHEIIVIDNKEKKWPIVRTHNEGVCQASYPFLFFVYHPCSWEHLGHCISALYKYLKP